MSKLKRTPGPWRWEFSSQGKRLHLVGGHARFDLTIMDFDRWGMSGAVATLRDPAEDGMNVMHRLCDRPDWIAPFPNRAHHAAWCSAVIHPDMQLIEAAPDLLDAVTHTYGCFEAALCEGWLDALAEGDIERIRDIWNRRLSCARDLIPAAIAKVEGAA